MTEPTAADPVQNLVHTPGPWAVDDLGEDWFLETNHRWGIGAVESPTYRIAKVEGMGHGSEANARLIAAAPELLEAIKRIQHFVVGGCDMPINRRLKCIVMECEASIAKVL